MRPGSGEVSRQVGCLLLARVDGKSPAEHLTSEGKPVAWDLGVRLLTEPVAEATQIWGARDARG